MRLIFWIIGAAATMAGGAAVLSRQRDRRTADDFLAAVRDGRVEEVVDRPGIGPGVRGGVIVGQADGSLFELTMTTDRHGVSRAYRLLWIGRDAVTGTHHLLKRGASAAALAEAYERLAKLCSRSKVPPN